MGAGELRFGTCSWNYDSWVPLVYPARRARAAEYLADYARKYRSAEVDSWFYKLPEPAEVREYRDAVDADFRFTIKAPERISLTHFRRKGGDDALVPNPEFLSVGLFEDFLRRIEPLLPQTDAIMLEFEYLNKRKMPSLEAFLGAVGDFARRAPIGLPLAVEPRNAAYVRRGYFEAVAEFGLMHVFSEKQFMPPAAELYAAHGDLVGDAVIVRLLGGDRKAIEAEAGGRWDKIIEEQPGRGADAGMLVAMLAAGKKVRVNVNNHYEGSAPLTIAALERLLAGA